MMLSAKIQVAQNLKADFKSIIDANTDSFNAQMVVDMKKVVSKALKDHHVNMHIEKQIIDNLKFSEEWFMRAYTKLKLVCGGAHRLVDVDFKEFMQILQCINGSQKEQMRNMKELIQMCQGVSCLAYGDDFESRNMPNISPIKSNVSAVSLKLENKSASSGFEKGLKSQPKLVCAAKNLHQSLMRCQWMIHAQQLIGIGAFASEKTQDEILNEKFRLENEPIEVSMRLKTKDIMEIIRLTEQMERLHITSYDFDSCRNTPNTEFSLIYEIMLRLHHFSKQYKRLVGENQENVSEVINQCEEKDSANLTIEHQLKKAVKKLEVLSHEFETLQNLRQKMNIINSAILAQDKLEVVIEQARTQVTLSIEFNKMKLQNSPSCKLTIEQSFYLQEKAQKLQGINQQSHIISKLTQNIQKFEKFRRNYSEYVRFKQRLADHIEQNEELGKKEGFSRDKMDLRFTYEFVQNLVTDTTNLDVDIFSEKKGDKNNQFDIKSLKKDLIEYDSFKVKFMDLLAKLENHIFEQQSSQAIEEIKEEGLFEEFYQMRVDITLLPLYDKPTFKKIQAFVWIFNAYELLETGQIDPDSPFYVQTEARSSDNTSQFLSIKQWKEFIKYHSNFESILPELKNHSIVSQLQWQIELANQIVEDIKTHKNIMKIFTGLFTRGADFYKHSNLTNAEREKEGQFATGGQYDSERKQGFFGKLSDKLQDLKNHENQKQGIIGPQLSKERLMAQFRRKTGIEEFTSKKDILENSLKINLSEEQRYLNKWISEYEEIEKYSIPAQSSLIKEKVMQIVELPKGERSESKKLIRPPFPYEPLFEHYTFEELKLIAKQVFVSPIYNWTLFSTLKKRLETAYEIRQDLKFMLKEQEFKFRDSQTSRLKISRVEPYLAQYWQNCKVRGIPEIDQMIEQVRQSKETIQIIKQKLLLNVEKEQIETEIQDQKQSLNEIKQLYGSLKIDFEDEENNIRKIIWKKEVGLLMDSNSSFTIDADEFKSLSSEFMDLRLKKDEGEESKWFQETRTSVNEVIRRLSKMEGDSEQEQIKAFISEKLELKKIDFKQLIEDKTARVNLNQSQSALRSSQRSKSDSPSRSSSSSTNQIKQKDSPANQSKNRSKSISSSGSSSSSSSGSQGSSSSSSRSFSKNSVDSSSSSGTEIGLAEGREKRKIIRKQDDDVIVFEKGKRQKTGENSEAASQSEMSQATKQRRKEEKIEKANSKRVQKEFEKQKEQEKKNRLKALGQEQEKPSKQSGFGISSQFNQAGMYNDKVFSDIRNQFQVKFRNDSKAKIINWLEKVKTFHELESKDSNQEQANDLEEKCFSLCNQKIDDNYSKRLENILKNLKFIAQNYEGQEIDNFKEFAEKILISKQIKLVMLLKPNPQFKDLASDIQQKINEKRKLQKAKNAQAEMRTRDMSSYVEKIVENKDEEIKEFPISVQAITPQLPQQPIIKGNVKNLYIEHAINKVLQVQKPAEQIGEHNDEFSDSDEDHVNESQVDDGAVFSSDEEAAPGKDNTDYKNPLDDLTSQVKVERKAPVVKYNPAQVVNQNRLIDQNNYYFNSNEGQKVVVPILYDPLHKTSINDFAPPIFIQPLNEALPGSLLKVWTGKLDLQTRQSPKHQLIEVECWSTQDIRCFQELPNWPLCLMNRSESPLGALQLRGNSEVGQVIKHFSMLEKDRKNIIKGWMTLHGTNYLNSHAFLTQFEDLRNSDKCSLFVLYEPCKSTNMHSFQGSYTQEIKEVHLYVMPITERTIDFCNFMQVVPIIDHTRKHSQMFAFFAHIKHPKYTLAEKINISKNRKNPTLNPLIDIELQILQATGQIPILPPLREPQPQPQNFGQFQPQLSNIIKQEEGLPDPEEDNKIDELILSLRQSNVGYEEIMQALLPYIKQKNISKQSEFKLMQFIQELIDQRTEQNRRAQEMQAQQMFVQNQSMLTPQIKQEQPDVPMYDAQQPIMLQYNMYNAPQMPMEPPGGVELTDEQISQLQHLQNCGQLNREQEALLQHNIEYRKYKAIYGVIPPQAPSVQQQMIQQQPPLLGQQHPAYLRTPQNPYDQQH